jgi:NADH-quinone oxidoreductase subunit E
LNLSEKTRSRILELQKIYPVKRSALIPALHLAQAEAGCLSREIQDEIAQLFDIDPNEVNAVVTFYDMFFEAPQGKHLIHICKNVSCMLRGGDRLAEKLCEKLGIGLKETTSDGEFTLIPSECLAACDLAPVMLVDDKVAGPVHEEDLDRLIMDAKMGPGHPAPVPTEVEHA